MQAAGCPTCRQQHDTVADKRGLPPFQDARTLVKVGDGSDNARVNPLNTQMARRHVKRSGREDEADLWIGVDLGMTYTGIAWRCLTGELKSNDST